MHFRKTSAVVAGAVVAAASLIAIGQLGPLNPPSGPVAGTGPSLADLESGDGVAAFEVFNAPSAGQFVDNFTSNEIVSGRALVHSITTHSAAAFVFDGQGEIGTGPSVTFPIVGEVVARVTASTATHTVEVNIVVENGLHVAWNAGTGAGFVTVVYQPLE